MIGRFKAARFPICGNCPHNGGPARSPAPTEVCGNSSNRATYSATDFGTNAKIRVGPPLPVSILSGATTT
jgi:hypothetical protein